MKKSSGGFGIVIFLVIIALIAYIVMRILGFGLGFGKGEGKGEGAGNNTPSSVASSQPDSYPNESPKSEDSNTVEVTIIVKKSSYYIEDKQVTLDGIQDQIQANSDIKLSIVIKDDYGSAKAWDDIQKLMNDLDIAYTEKR